MTPNDPSESVVEDRYTPAQNRTLVEAVLDVIEQQKNEDLRQTEFTLYDSIDPDVLNHLFRPETHSDMQVAFTTDDVQVELWENHGVEIRVRDRQPINW